MSSKGSIEFIDLARQEDPTDAFRSELKSLLASDKGQQMSPFEIAEIAREIGRRYLPISAEILLVAMAQRSDQAAFTATIKTLSRFQLMLSPVVAAANVLSNPKRIEILATILRSKRDRKEKIDDIWFGPVKKITDLITSNIVDDSAATSKSVISDILESLVKMKIPFSDHRFHEWRDYVATVLLKTLRIRRSIDDVLLWGLRHDKDSENLATLTFCDCNHRLVKLYCDPKNCENEPPTALTDIITEFPPQSLIDKSQITELYSVFFGKYARANPEPVIILVTNISAYHFPELCYLSCIAMAIVDALALTPLSKVSLTLSLFLYMMCACTSLRGFLTHAQEMFCETVLSTAKSYTGNINLSDTLKIITKFTTFDSRVRTSYRAVQNNKLSRQEPLSTPIGTIVSLCI